jgi:hypothetical protein
MDDPMFLLGILQSLIAIYGVVQKNDGFVRVLQEITVKVQTEHPLDSRQFVKRQLEERLQSSDAMTISKDISLLEALFTFKATSESFDYFGILADVFKNVVEFCSRTGIFKLRGGQATDGRALLLKQTVLAIYTPRVQRELASLYTVQTPIETRPELLLIDEMTPRNTWCEMDASDVLPLISSMRFSYKQRHYWNDAISQQVDDIGLVYVGRAEENHWISFIADRNTAIAMNHSVMLRSSDVKTIVDALSEDILGYVQDIKGDQEYGDTVLRAETNNLIAALQFRAH